MRKAIRARERGYLLVIAMCVITVLGLMITAYAALDVAGQAAARQSRLDAQARAAAEAAVELGFRAATKGEAGALDLAVGVASASATWGPRAGERFVVRGSGRVPDGDRTTSFAVTQTYARRPDGSWARLDRMESRR